MRNAFTLMETLVVTAVLAVLAAILWPVFQECRESARQAVCLSNMMQLGLAQNIYLSDYDERWHPPSYRSPVVGLPGWQTVPWLGYDNRWNPAMNRYTTVYQPAVLPIVPGILDPYLRDEGVKRCPSMPKGWQIAYALNYWRNSEAGAEGDEFAPCCRRLVVTASDLHYMAATLSEVDEPAQTLSLWEHEATSPLCYYLQVPGWPTSVRQAPPDDNALRLHFHYLHRAGSNGVWCDGHAKRLTYDGLRRPWFSSRKDIYGN